MSVPLGGPFWLILPEEGRNICLICLMQHLIKAAVYNSVSGRMEPTCNIDLNHDPQVPRVSRLNAVLTSIMTPSVPDKAGWRNSQNIKVCTLEGHMTSSLSVCTDLSTFSEELIQV